MADDVTAPGTGEIFATDQINLRHFPKTKIVHGADGIATDATMAAGLPVALDTASLAALENTTVTVGTALPPGTNTIGTVGLDAAALAALESITVVGRLLPSHRKVPRRRASTRL
jgi:hypothetical protein